MTARRKMALLVVFLTTVIALFAVAPVASWVEFALTKMHGGYTVAERVEQYGEQVLARLEPDFANTGLAYPPRYVALVAFKDAKRLELHAKGSSADAWRRVREYPILAASGRAGPKLREGDRQVPEGIYRLESLNPNSRYHLALRLDYPNAFDRRMAALEGRIALGGDIMIHGNAVSIGCLAIGDEAAEDLFVLAALAGKENVEIIVAPTDLRVSAFAPRPEDPSWIPVLYEEILTSLGAFVAR
ncbi:MAG TPA: L,D-transpeptidase family protein [Candidatus Saccharimonadia bacterium]|nr:L,D-transpeptidase family protein [Candidatus Saccharimonadia bacterium]